MEEKKEKEQSQSETLSSKEEASELNPETKAQNGKEKKKNKWIRFFAILFSSVVVLLLILFGAYHAILEYYLGKINVVTKEETNFVTQRLEDENNTVGTAETIERESSEEAEKEPIEEIESLYGSENLPLICDDENVTNILLLATDVYGDAASRSDTMILLSINSKTKQLILCSFLRDIWAKYPVTPSSPVSGSYDKLNHAYAYGGPALTMAVIKETFNIQVNYYVKVDFTTFTQMVDSVGGVELELSAEEAKYINKAAGSKLSTPVPEVNGKYVLDGRQALWHARNRTIGADWARTERQRKIIMQLFFQAKNLSLKELDALLDTVFPLITTNMPVSMLKSFVSKSVFYFGYDLVSTRIPMDGTYSSINYNLVPDLEKNCNALYEKIYGKSAK